MQSPQLETKGQQNKQIAVSPQLENKGQHNKRIAVSPQLETKGQQNKRIAHEIGKQSPQLKAKVIQRKQQNVEQSPQLESVQSETKSHQIKEMRKQGDRQYRLSGNVQNEHQPVNSKHPLQLVDSSCQDSSVATSQVMQYPQPENVKNEHRPDNYKNQPQLVDSSCQDNFVSTSRVMQYPQSEDVLKEHQPDNSQYQLQLIDTSHLDNSWDNSAATFHDLQSLQSGNVQNQHCSGRPYPHLDIRTSQPKQIDTSHKESSTSREDLDSTSNRQDAKHTPQGLMESNQDWTNKPYLQLDNRTNQLQQVDTSHQESSDDQTSREELGSTIHQQDPQWLFVPNQQQPSKPYPHLDNRTYQPQQVDTSHQESSDDQTSREEIDRTINREDPQWMFVPNQQQHSKPYPQLDIRTYQPQQVNSSFKESSDDPTSGKGIVSAVSKDVMQYLQLETVLYQQQLDTPYPQLDVETYQLQPVDTSRQESFDDLTSGKELVSAYNKDILQPPQLDRLQPSKPYPQLDIRLYQLQQVDNSYQESSDDATSGKELDQTLNKFKLCEVYHTLVQLKDKHVEEAAESVVLWRWFFIKCDPQLGILSTMKSHMAGGNLMTIGFKIDPVNLQKLDISNRRVTSKDPVAMVTCKLDYVDESNLGSKFVIPGSAYSSTVEDTLQVVNTTFNCDTEPVLRTVVQYEIEIHTFEPFTPCPPGRDGQYAVVPRRMQDILKYAGYEFPQDCHPQGSSSIEGIVGGTCTLIKYCQKVVMVTSSEGSDPETSHIWDPGGASRFVKRRD